MHRIERFASESRPQLRGYDILLFVSKKKKERKKERRNRGETSDVCWPRSSPHSPFPHDPCPSRLNCLPIPPQIHRSAHPLDTYANGRPASEDGGVHCEIQNSLISPTVLMYPSHACCSFKGRTPSITPHSQITPRLQTVGNHLFKPR